MKRKPPLLDAPYRKYRPLSEDEARLWQETMAGRKKPSACKIKAIIEPAPWANPPQRAAQMPVKESKSKKEITPVAVDARMRAQMRRGKLAVQATLDLHGFTKATAHMTLIRFVAQAQTEGVRLALIITGKGRTGQKGILREQLPRWLDEFPLRGQVIAYDSAGPRHGGEGAWYVRIRKIETKL